MNALSYLLYRLLWMVFMNALFYIPYRLILMKCMDDLSYLSYHLLWIACINDLSFYHADEHRTLMSVGLKLNDCLRHWP